MSVEYNDIDITEFQDTITYGDISELVNVYNKIKNSVKNKTCEDRDDVTIDNEYEYDSDFTDEESDDDLMDVFEPVDYYDIDESPFSIAVSYGYDDITKWIFNKFRRNVIENIYNNIKTFCELGRLDILKWIDNNEDLFQNGEYDHDEPYDKTKAFLSALKHNKTDILKYLYNQNSSIILTVREDVESKIIENELPRDAVEYYIGKLIENCQDVNSISEHITNMIHKQKKQTLYSSDYYSD